MTGIDSSEPVAGPSGTPKTARDGLRFVIAMLVIMFGGIAAATMVRSPWLTAILVPSTIAALLATSAGFLLRNNGSVSFGQAVYSGLAAYCIGVCVERFGLRPEIAILVAVVCPLGLAVIIGLIACRVSGIAFSMITLALSQVFFEVAMKWRGLANGDDGLAIEFPKSLFGLQSSLLHSLEVMFSICWIVLILTIVGLWFFSRSAFGTLTLAIKENEERARFLGYGTLLPRVVVLAISGLIAAFAGVLYALHNAFISPEATFHWSISGAALIMAVIGGASRVWGPALGAFIFLAIKNAVGDLTEHWLGIIGLLLIAVTIAVPGGLSQLFDQWRERRSMS